MNSSFHSRDGTPTVKRCTWICPNRFAAGEPRRRRDLRDLVKELCCRDSSAYDGNMQSSELDSRHVIGDMQLPAAESG